MMALLESYEGQLPVQFVERMQTAIEEENHGAEDIDEICVLRAFQDALGRMFTRGANSGLTTFQTMPFWQWAMYSKCS